jgi:hypothetical protein
MAFPVLSAISLALVVASFAAVVVFLAAKNVYILQIAFYKTFLTFSNTICNIFCAFFEISLGCAGIINKCILSLFCLVFDFITS